ncbi:MAG TPA: hypothetical protein VFA76_00775 [Terriglobales bacterium]|nr:hypothetical protein [Terriglobales bacterium]
MARKRKQKFRAVKAVKAAAREHVGMPPPTRRVEQRIKKNLEKHKPTLEKLLEDE